MATGNLYEISSQITQRSVREHPQSKYAQTWWFSDPLTTPPTFTLLNNGTTSQKQYKYAFVLTLSPY